MSTTFKIIQNHIQSSKNSAKKSNSLSPSQHLTPNSKFNDSIDDDDDSIGNEEVLRMEIRQLERENKFLKKKICELTAEINGYAFQPKKSKVNGKGAIIKEQQDPTDLTIQFFFKQINGMLNSLTDLFKVQFTESEAKQFSLRFPVLKKLNPETKRYTVFKKFTLTRKLQKITLQPEQKRYQILIDTFLQFYSSKQECDRYIREVVDNLSSRAIQLNKMILQHANKRRSSVRGSRIKSVFTGEDSAQKANTRRSVDEQMMVPWVIRKISPEQTLSSEKYEGRIKSEIKKRF